VTKMLSDFELFRREPFGAELRKRLRSDPVFFCRHILGIEPWSKQAEVLQALRDDDMVAVRSGHGTGKSFIASAAALWFLYSYYPAKVITTAPTWNQVRQILWSEIRRMHAMSRMPLGGKVLEERIKLSDGAYAVGISTDEAERFQGFHAESVFVILDEAPGVREEIWEAAQTLLTGSVGKILAIGNPTKPTGIFYEIFNPASEWRKIRISCLDSPNVTSGRELYPRLVTRKWVERRRQEWGEDTPLYRSRVLGEFPEDEQSVLIPRHWLEGEKPKIKRNKGQRYLGVNVAREGKDATVFLIRNEREIIYVREEHGISTMESVGIIVRLMKEKNISEDNVFIDDTGLGAGVTDRLRELDYEVNAVIAAAKANNPARFINLRAEMFWRLREDLNPEKKEGPLYINNRYTTLKRELCALTYEFNSGGGIKIIDKIKLRGKISGSPNHADSLALTYAGSRRRKDIEISIL